MKQGVSAFIVGIIFALGLGISGMTSTENVVSFLDIFGQWNPSLIFVMMGAITVHALSYRLIIKRKSPLLAAEFFIPKHSDVNMKLILGAVIFGLGWGLVGYCPAPAIVSLATFSIAPVVFVIAMIIGMLLVRFMKKNS